MSTNKTAHFQVSSSPLLYPGPEISGRHSISQDLLPAILSSDDLSGDNLRGDNLSGDELTKGTVSFPP